jgi:hypothetical protein
VAAGQRQRLTSRCRDPDSARRRCRPRAPFRATVWRTAVHVCRSVRNSHVQRSAYNTHGSGTSCTLWPNCCGVPVRDHGISGRLDMILPRPCKSLLRREATALTPTLFGRLAAAGTAHARKWNPVVLRVERPSDRHGDARYDQHMARQRNRHDGGASPSYGRPWQPSSAHGRGVRLVHRGSPRPNMLTAPSYRNDFSVRRQRCDNTPQSRCLRLPAPRPKASSSGVGDLAQSRSSECSPF